MKTVRKCLLITLLLLSLYAECQNMSSLIDSGVRKYGSYLSYTVLPAHRFIELVAIESKDKFDKALVENNATQINIDYSQLRTPDDSSYCFSLARMSLVTVYKLMNGLYAIDQSINSKANPYYLCRSLDEFKLITKFLLVFQPEPGKGYEIQCSIFEHFAIKDFLEHEKTFFKFIKNRSDERFKFYLAKDGKCIYVSYWGKMNGKWKDYPIINYPYERIKNEDEFFWSVTIYESIEKFKMHNIHETN